MVFEGVNYPRYNVSYKANVGASLDNIHKVYYNSKTCQIERFGFRVTFRSKTATDNFKITRNNSLWELNGILLPKAITYYKKDVNVVLTEYSKVVKEFTLSIVSIVRLVDSFFKIS